MLKRPRKIVSTDIPFLVQMFCSEKGAVRSHPTVVCVSVRLNHFIRWIAMRGHSIDPKRWTADHALEYRKYLLDSGLKTASDLFTQAKYFFRWMVLRGFAPKNPFDGIVAPPVIRRKTREPISDEEFRKIVGYIKTQLRQGDLISAVFVIGYYTGMAVSDCAFLKWAHVDMDACVIRRNRLKTDVRSTIPFERGGELCSILETMKEKYPPANDESFVVPLGGSTSYQKVLKAFAKARKELGISKEKTFHNFRATMASRLINGGVSSIIARRITGHSTLQVFDKYVTIDDAVLEKAVRDAGYISSTPKVGQEIQV